MIKTNSAKTTAVESESGSNPKDQCLQAESDTQIDFKNFKQHKVWLETQSQNFNKNKPIEATAQDLEHMRTFTDNEACVICNQPTASNLNKILFCDLCNAGFHEACYGVQAPENMKVKWFCDSCKTHKLDGLRLKCSECPCLGGGMKQLQNQSKAQKKIKSMIGRRADNQDSLSEIENSESQEDISLDIDSDMLSTITFYSIQYFNTVSKKDQDDLWVHVNCAVAKMKNRSKSYFAR